MALWDSTTPVAERINGFSSALPADLLPSPSAKLQIASFLLMADPTEFVIYRPTPFKSVAELVEFGKFPDGPESAIYEHALAFVDAVVEAAGNRGVELRDRLDAQSLIWAVAKNDPLRYGMSPDQAEAFLRYRGTTPAVWWVNEGGSWKEEIEHGRLVAPVTNKAGHVLQHHKNVSRLRKGDIILHHWEGAVRAVGVVSAKPTTGKHPWDPDDEQVRRVAKFEAFELADPIAIQDIDSDRRVDEPGPFDSNGGVKQVYLMPLTVGFSEWLQREFRDRWPEGSPWAPTQRTTWLFQANPDLWPLAERVAQMEVEEEETFTVSRYKTEIGVGDRLLLWQAGSKAGIYGVGAISGDLFQRGEDDEHYSSDEGESAIPWRLTGKLDKPILRQDLIDHPVLKGLSVITAPQGSNFKVTVEQWAELRKLLDADGPIEPAAPAATVEEIAAFLADQGMSISDRTVRRFHVALGTRGFVILSGISGTGKTWLTELYASATGAEYHLEPVAPNWTTNEDLLGYLNPIDGAYHDTPFSLFLREAAKEFAEATAGQRTPKKYLLALDEMNLARVEYYFARFLSLMEVRARRGSVEIPLGPDETVTVGSNLLFVGTVNVDETTHGFADKVFDRAQLIELEAPRPAIVDHIGGGAYADSLLEVYDAVAEARPFGFRVVDDIKEYIGESEGLDVSWNEALDEQILQKVLPKMSGAEPSIGLALERLVDVAKNLGLHLTLAKAQRMSDDYARDGFTSYF